MIREVIKYLNHKINSNNKLTSWANARDDSGR